jgi:hypothetical protein
MSEVRISGLCHLPPVTRYRPSGLPGPARTLHARHDRGKVLPGPRERGLGAVLRALTLASPHDVVNLASLIPYLNPSAAERAEATAQVKRVLGETCCRCYPRRPGERHPGRGHIRLFDPDDSPAHVLAELAVSEQERAQAADELIALLGRCAETQAEGFSAAIDSLDPSAAQRETAGNILLARLPAERKRWDIVSMPGAIASLCQAPAQRAAALQALTKRILSADAYDLDSPEMTAEITKLITDLAGDDHDLGRARAILAAEWAGRGAASWPACSARAALGSRGHRFPGAGAAACGRRTPPASPGSACAATRPSSAARVSRRPPWSTR